MTGYRGEWSPSALVAVESVLESTITLGADLFDISGSAPRQLRVIHGIPTSGRSSKGLALAVAANLAPEHVCSESGAFLGAGQPVNLVGELVGYFDDGHDWCLGRDPARNPTWIP